MNFKYIINAFIHNNIGENMFYLNYFFVFSIIGHIVESFVYSNGESGILFGWWTPVYGIGVLIILLIHKLIDKIKLNKIGKGTLLFLLSALILSIIEAIGGYLIEWLFNYTFWDYCNYKFNIGKYAALEMALIWGVSSLILIYILKPLLDKIISKIPKYFTYILSVLLILDLFFTIILKH